LTPDDAAALLERAGGRLRTALALLAGEAPSRPRTEQANQRE
jgi:hypothetical protein